MNDQDIQEDSGLIDRIKESPRTVSALIIILIVAAAIYAFSDNKDQSAENTVQPDENSTEQGNQTTNDEAKQLAELPDLNQVTESKQPQVAAGTTDNQTDTTNTSPELTLPEPHRTEQGFIEVAQAGNGVTHLARRASTRWLSENQAGYAVTDEHRIYIEDYIQNRLGTQSLNLGETMTINYDLIQEAVASAQQLNQQQLNNLSQYTYVLR